MINGEILSHHQCRWVIFWYEGNHNLHSVEKGFETRCWNIFIKKNIYFILNFDGLLSS